MCSKNKQQGYIALMATIIISLMLLVMIFKESTSGWSSRFNILGTESKEQASALAEGCAEQALASLLTDPNYTGNIDIVTTDGTCHIYPTQINYPVTGLVTVKTQAVVRGSYANLDMAMNMNDIHLGGVPVAPTTGTLFVITHVINNGSGTSLASNFNMSVSANPNSTFAGSESGVAVTVQPGAYSISETLLLPNYSKSSTVDCSGNIIAGGIKFCTITYDDITTTLTLLANVTNNDSGVKLPTDFPLFIDGSSAILGQSYTVTAGSHNLSFTPVNGYAASPWGYDCTGSSISISLGQNKTCTINFDDDPAPTPSCAETVMMLDRSGSMFPTYGGGVNDIPNEKNAAKSLVSLFNPLSPHPKIGVGRFGDVASGVSAEIIATLTTDYTNLPSIIDNGLPGSPLSYTNLSAAITKGSEELNSSRHVSGKEQVLVLVSDGDPNRPSGSTTYDTGFKSATLNQQNQSGEFWSTPIEAYADGGLDASDPISDNDRHQFYNFNFGGGTGTPATGSVTGIEASLDAWATAGTVNTPSSMLKNPTSATTPNNWANATQAFSSNDSYATSSTNGQQQGYGNFGFTIPSNATITGVQVNAEAKTSSGASVNTATLFPVGQGNYTSWTNGVSTVDEVGSPDCSSGDSIIENNSNDRESVTLNISSIPNGATITDVTVSSYDRGDSNSGGTYKTFARLDGNNYDASSNLSATGTSGCNLKTQSINVTNTIKANSTSLEIGVIKVSGNNNTVRVGAIRAVVTYTVPTVGTLDIALSSSNGGSWTSPKNVSLTTVEVSSSPVGNNSTDLWSRTWVPADFNNGNFVLRVQNNSANGVTVSLDQVSVNVFYTVPVSSGTSCQIGVDLSWNAGASWSSEKIQTITGTENTYTLGGASDDWSSSHSWQPTEFSNSNFRARVRAIDPGSGCDNTAVDHLDWLQLKVYYSQNSDPVQDALNAADTAKLSGISIFTIHFGSDPGPYNGKKLLANLATGSVLVSGHQNGSFSDPGGVVSGNTGQVSPTISTSDTGGDGNGFEINPTNTFADGPNGVSGAGQNVDGAGDRHRFSGYNIVIPPNATITGIQTRLDWWLDSTSGTNSLGVELSWNGGATWTSAKLETNESTNTSNSRTLGGSADTWGHAWTASELNSTNFKVRVTSNATTSTRDFYLDWIPVTVYYSVNQENGDGDNFFVAPTSADMQGIFNFIGQQVCPALVNLTPPPPPTTSTISVITQVVNNNGGSKVSSDFTANVSAINPSQSSFAGNSTGISITVDPGAYNITQSAVNGYTASEGVTCSSSGSSGNIVAGENRVCILTNDDIPPPPPPPNLNFDPSSWHEVPTAN